MRRPCTSCAGSTRGPRKWRSMAKTFKAELMRVYELTRPDGSVVIAEAMGACEAHDRHLRLAGTGYVWRLMDERGSALPRLFSAFRRSRAACNANEGLDGELLEYLGEGEVAGGGMR